MHERTKLGIVGPNGSGKTTLLRLLAGELRPDSGEVVRKQGLVLGRVAQDDRELLALDPTVADALYRSQAELELERLAGELAEAAHDPQRLRELERAYDDALAALSAAHEPDRSLIADLLGELGLRSVPESRRMSELSGGQRRLVLLARALASDPDLLVLDEPEAHLDLRARGLVAERLGTRRGATVLVSHDRALLDVATKETLDLSDGRCDLYAGGYSFYLEERPKLMARLQGEYERAVAEVKRQEQVFFQYREWARLNSKFASRARARLTLLERARSRVERPEKRRDRTLSVSFASDARGRVMAEATRAEVSYSESVRIGPVDLVLERGDRVALIGPNGTGKSTLLRLLAGLQEPTAGRVRVKEGATVSLMTQESLSLDLERTPLDVVLDERAMGRDDAVRRICALGLDYEHCLAPLGRLSGGQRVRVHLLRVSLQRPDLLLLDEPTNYIDTHSAEVVQSELEAFTGCVVAATHDRYFLDTFATRIVELTRVTKGTRVDEREGTRGGRGMSDALTARYRARSLWLDGLAEPLTPRPSLAGDRECDVAIVGAGFTGLWAAYFLAKLQPDLRIAVVEREIAGFGPSGRNGGWASAGIAGSAAALRAAARRRRRAPRRARDGRLRSARSATSSPPRRSTAAGATAAR